MNAGGEEARKNPVRAAAGGSTEALREMANQAYIASLAACSSVERLTRLVEALTYCRLVAIHGERSDLRCAAFLCGEVAACCRCLGDAAAGTNYEAWGLLVAEAIADAGDEEVGALIPQCVDAVAPETLLEVQRLRDLVASSSGSVFEAMPPERVTLQ